MDSNSRPPMDQRYPGGTLERHPKDRGYNTIERDLRGKPHDMQPNAHNTLPSKPKSPMRDDYAKQNGGNGNKYPPYPAKPIATQQYERVSFIIGLDVESLHYRHDILLMRSSSDFSHITQRMKGPCNILALSI
jgi:hypothetical protein